MRALRACASKTGVLRSPARYAGHSANCSHSSIHPRTRRRGRADALLPRLGRILPGRSKGLSAKRWANCATFISFRASRKRFEALHCIPAGQGNLQGGGKRQIHSTHPASRRQKAGRCAALQLCRIWRL